MSLSIRQIGPDEAEAYRTIRLIALEGDPASFASDVQTERDRPLDWYAQGTRDAAIFVAFEDDRPVGMDTVIARAKTKAR